MLGPWEARDYLPEPIGMHMEQKQKKTAVIRSLVKMRPW